MNRRQLLQLGLLSLLPASICASEAVAAPEFLLFGTRALFATHLFEFCPGRNLQVLLRLRSPKPGKKLSLGRGDDLPRLRCPGLDLTQLRPGRKDRLRELKGDWIGRTRINAPLEVLEILFYSQIDAAEKRSRLADYFVFGGGREWYAMHRISGAPDFEHVWKLGQGQRQLHPSALQAENQIKASKALTTRLDQILVRPIEADCDA